MRDVDDRVFVWSFVTSRLGTDDCGLGVPFEQVRGKRNEGEAIESGPVFSNSDGGLASECEPKVGE